MKKSGVLAAAAAAAASATAISASSSNTTFTCNSDLQLSHEDAGSNKEKKGSSSTDKFAPRFDGLRFIETLVTAHR